MSRPPSLPTLRRQILAELPLGTVDLGHVPEFMESFGSAVFEAADMAALLVGTLPPADLSAAVERMARIVVSGIATAADQLDVARHPWVAEAQRWAVEAFFDCIAEVSRRAHHPEAVEIVEVLAFVPTTRRKGLRVARVRQGGADLIEIRAVNLDPKWEPSAGDHRTVIRSSAVGRVVAALRAAEMKAETQS